MVAQSTARAVRIAAGFAFGQRQISRGLRRRFNCSTIVAADAADVMTIEEAVAVVGIALARLREHEEERNKGRHSIVASSSRVFTRLYTVRYAYGMYTDGTPDTRTPPLYIIRSGGVGTAGHSWLLNQICFGGLPKKMVVEGVPVVERNYGP